MKNRLQYIQKKQLAKANCLLTYKILVKECINFEVCKLGE